MSTPHAFSHTRELLEALAEGRPRAADELFDHLYGQLRELARLQLAGRNGSPTLQPTALVHEVWLKIGTKPLSSVESRRHFFRLASRAMRDVLVDAARRRRAEKRGGDAPTVPLDEVLLAWREGTTLDPLVLDEELDRLAQKDPRMARVVELRFFAGLTIAECAEVLELTRRQVEHAWKLARALLVEALRERD